jgi:alcohol dehydrogenase class IV
MLTTWTFHSAGEIVFGDDATEQLGERVRRLGLGRVFLVADRWLAAAGIVERIVRPLAAADCQVQVFADGEPEPPTRVALAAAEAARPFVPDCILGLGGGSNMDLAKIVALLLAHGGAPRDYFGENRVPGAVLPLVCVPTTAGTGSEVTPAAVLTDSEAGVKVSTLSERLRPKLAVVDPLLALACPAVVTADAGIDALTHAIEAYTAVDYAQFPLPPEERSIYQGHNPLSDALALEAIGLVGRWLAVAVERPDDRAARRQMALAALLAGLAFSNSGVALVHAMEYPVGAAVHCSHGRGNGLLLPHVMRFNRPECQERLKAVGQRLGAVEHDLPIEAAAEQAIAAVDRLRARIGVPGRLRELGATAEMLPAFAEKAFAIKRVLRVNPRPVTQADILGIYQAAL